jgi:hypothetical protein
MSERKRLAFDSGGVDCVGHLCRPENSANGMLPCVVMGHRSQPHDGEPVSGRGAILPRLACVRWSSTIATTRKWRSTAQFMGTERQAEDWRAAIRLARSCAGVDPKRIALWRTLFS